jgi:hypothetical protein
MLAMQARSGRTVQVKDSDILESAIMNAQVLTICHQ